MPSVSYTHLASILNVKYVNSSALHRVEQEFQRNGVNISRQTMSNWIIRCAEKYFAPFVDRMKQELLSLPVTQSDETPTQVIGDSDRPNSKCELIDSCVLTSSKKLIFFVI